MNIAIVDDDVDFSSELQQYVKKFIERLYTRYEIDIINNNFFNNKNKRSVLTGLLFYLKYIIFYIFI